MSHENAKPSREGDPQEQPARSTAAPVAMPDSSRATASQRLGDVDVPHELGHTYETTITPLHPPGWRMKRYVMRKKLRRNTMRFRFTDRRSTRWSILPMTISLFILMIFLLVAGSVIAAFISATDQRFGERVTTLQDMLPKDNLKIYDSKGKMIFQALDQGRQTSIPLEKISKHMINAQVSIEDQNFWDHPGFDITGIVRAALDNLMRGRIVSGASTITQQLIKNAIVGDETSVMRKLEEIILSPEISRRYTKEQILSMYLNTTYYGQQAYGVEAAAMTYFGLKEKDGKPASSQLSIAQSAVIAGIPSSPIARDPFLHPQASLARTQEVLRAMYSQKYITYDEFNEAMGQVREENFFKPGDYPKNDVLLLNLARHTQTELADILHVKVEDLSRAGLSVKTTYDIELQLKVQEIARKHIEANRHAHHMSNAAVAVIDFKTGAIKSMVGNIDPTDPKSGQFDVASQGYRQPGSSFKPYIYATAFAMGVSPGEPVWDVPYAIQMCCGLPPYEPKNYDLGYHGLMSYRYALQNSFNIPAVKLLQRVGVEPALETAQKMGILSYLGTPNYSMVLGTLSVKLLDQTSGFGVFANGGKRVPHSSVESIRDVSAERDVYHHTVEEKQVISPQVAYMVTDVMTDNVSRTFEFGKCSALYLYTASESSCNAGNPGKVYPAAAKTGTSTDFVDNWTVGYTTEYVVGVWAGNNDNSPMHNVSGVDGAGPIWHDTMLVLHAGKDPKNFIQPPGLEKRTVHYDQGITTTDWYLK